MLDLLFGQDGCEVFHLEDLADFDFALAAGAAVGGALDPLDGLFEGIRLSNALCSRSAFSDALKV